MKIIRQGSLPENRVYRATCRRCDTEIEFARHEATYVPDQRDGDYLVITCPTCMTQIMRDVR